LNQRLLATPRLGREAAGVGTIVLGVNGGTAANSTTFAVAVVSLAVVAIGVVVVGAVAIGAMVAVAGLAVVAVVVGTVVGAICPVVGGATAASKATAIVHPTSTLGGTMGSPSSRATSRSIGTVGRSRDSRSLSSRSESKGGDRQGDNGQTRDEGCSEFHDLCSFQLDALILGLSPSQTHEAQALIGAGTLVLLFNN